MNPAPTPARNRVLHPSPSSRTQRRGAFTLVEMLVVLIVIGIVSTIALPPFSRIIQTARIRAERETLLAFKADVERTFSITGSRFLVENLSAIDGLVTMPYSASPTSLGTVFDTSTHPEYDALSSRSWLYKLSLARGFVPTAGQPVTATEQPAIHDEVLINAYGNPRLLFCHVPADVTQPIRYLFVSLMAAPSRGLVIPDSDGTTAWFDELWNHSWEMAANSLPAGWATRLTSQELNAWAARPENTSLVVVQRITQPRYTVTLSNTHNAIHGFPELGLRQSANAPHPMCAWIVRPYTWTGTPAGGANAVTLTGVPAGTTLVIRRSATALPFNPMTEPEAGRYLVGSDLTLSIDD